MIKSGDFAPHYILITVIIAKTKNVNKIYVK